MGKTYDVKCSVCDYQEKFYIGIGKDDTNVAEEAMEILQAGGYGEEARLFCMQAENSEIECKRMLYRCRKCGNLETKVKIRIITDNISFSQPYYCTKCEKLMGQVKPADIKKQLCPKCGKEICVVSVGNF